LGAAFLLKKIRRFFWHLATGERRTTTGKQRTATGKRRTNIAKFRLYIWLIKLQNVVEIEWRIFRQTRFAGNFSLSEKSLMKSTPGLMIRVFVTRML
jgi:hypothetical protein